MRVIFHIDLNAFFANAELLRRPELTGKPIVIGRDHRRSVVSTASYEARRYGIHSAMPIFQAKSLCRHLVIVEPDFNYYRELSRQFFDVIKQYSPYIEKASIDEGYVDMSDYIERTRLQPYDVAKKMQNDILETTGLTCSIGISPNKFLSKMASDMKKPMGITIITQANIKEVLWPLSISEMHGIGKKTAPKLIEAGIKTIGDLANGQNYDTARQILGSSALIYYNLANGHDKRQVDYQPYDPKSVGNSTTFENDITGEAQILEAFRPIAQKVSERAKKGRLLSKNISITLRDNQFHTIQRSMIMDEYTNDAERLYGYAMMLVRQSYNGEPIRLIGLTMNNVMRQDQIYIQMSLFDQDFHDQKEKDEISQLLEEHQQLMRTSDLLKKTSKE